MQNSEFTPYRDTLTQKYRASSKHNAIFRGCYKQLLSPCARLQIDVRLF